MEMTKNHPTNSAGRLEMSKHLPTTFVGPFPPTRPSGYLLSYTFPAEPNISTQRRHDPLLGQQHINDTTATPRCSEHPRVIQKT